MFDLEENNLNQSLILENRKNFTISGVKDCLGFDEETINLNTNFGKMTIKGIGLHIMNFDTESGQLNAEGKFNAIVYTASENSGGFFKKIFK